MIEIPVERLHELFWYEPVKGALFWKKTNGRIKAGRMAGSIGSKGYLVVGIDGARVLVHRVIWAFCFGKWPEELIDHENTEPDDNRIFNLREADKSGNACNQNIRSDNTSGYKGVVKIGGRWRAQIGVDGKCKNLGLFDTPEAASLAYHNASKIFHAEFGRTA